MLSVSGSPQWHTVVGGSRTYVERDRRAAADVRIATPVTGVAPQPATASTVRDDARGATQRFDRVVIATHADQALRAARRRRPRPSRRCSGAFGYSAQRDRAAHRRLDPAARAAGARVVELPDALVHGAPAAHARQLLDEPPAGARRATATTSSRSTATGRVDPGSVIATMTYEHPLYTPASVAAQRRLPELNGDRDRLRRGLPRLGLPRGRLPLGRRRRRALGPTW